MRVVDVGKVLVLVSCMLLAGVAAHAQVTVPELGAKNATQNALTRISQDYPGVEFYFEGQIVSRVSGVPFGYGSSPEDSAGQFLTQHSDVFGVQPDNLQAATLSGTGPLVQPVMFDWEQQAYKFALIRYVQDLGGIPVFRAEVRLLMRNESDFPLVLAASSLRDLGSFVVNPAALPVEFDPATDADTGMEIFSEPETVIWAGLNDETPAPVLAVSFIGQRGSMATKTYEEYLYVANAATGEILLQEDRIIFEDVTGNVSGLATEGIGADICENEVSMALPYAYVEIQGGNSAFANVNGDFVIGNPGTDDVTVESPIRGMYFAVTHFTGTDELLTQLVTPPGPANFLQNAANTSEFVRAQVNGYVESNRVRDFILQYNPAYPSIATETNFPVRVNRDDGYCPGNAWYSPGEQSINFCEADTSDPNTAWSGIVHHEYGHRLVNAAGSGQGQYGEGMGDVMGLLISDEPGAGAWGWNLDCNGALRWADNSFQYPCEGEIHYCGQLLSGFVWCIRDELVITEPGSYLDVLSPIAINAMLVHTGDLITPQITIDYLTLDDNDGDLSNGTPHYREIARCAVAHNMYDPATFPQLPPVAVCTEGTFARDADANCCTTITVADIDAGSFDLNGPDDIASICITDIDGNPVGCEQSVQVCDPGSHTVTLTITDDDGASDSCDVSVQIADVTPPVITVTFDDPTPIELDDNCEATVNFTVTVEDNCCVDPNDVGFDRGILAGTCTLGAIELDPLPASAPTVVVTGSFLVSNVTECPVEIEMQVTAADCTGNNAGPTASDPNAIITDSIAPVASITITNAVSPIEVDENCEAYVEFAGGVTDNCCLDPSDLTFSHAVLSGAGTVGTIEILEAASSGKEVTFSGRVLVSDLTECPLVLELRVDATDCCDNPAAQAATDPDAQVVDLIPPEITCPPDIILERGDKLCNSDVQDWLDSATATDNCDTDVDIVDDSAANGFACGFPYDSTTEVTWTATDDCGNTDECSAFITIKQAPRVDMTRKGSLLIFSKVELRWNAAGELIQDTFLDITNDYPGYAMVQMYFVNGDEPLDASANDRAHLGWNWVDNLITLTGDEPAYWSAASGHPKGVSPFTILDPSEDPLLQGRPANDTTGDRVLRGMVLAWAVNSDGKEIRWNHLKGDALLVHYGQGAAWEYNAWAFSTRCLEQGAQPLDCVDFDANGVCCVADVIPGNLDLDAFQYDLGFEQLILDFYAVGVDELGEVETTDTDLTLFPLEVDVRQETMGPVTTKAKFDIWNMNEVKFSGTERCITCWDQELLSNYEAPNHFLREHLQTNKGKARIDGMQSMLCSGSVEASLLGVSMKLLGFNAGVDFGMAGNNLFGAGYQSGSIQYDPFEPPPELAIPTAPVKLPPTIAPSGATDVMQGRPVSGR